MKYLQFVKNHTLDTDPLQFWKARKNDCPNLAKAARVILAIVAQAAGSERVWSVLSNIVNKYRCKLNKYFAADLVKSCMRSKIEMRIEKEGRKVSKKKSFPPFGQFTFDPEDHLQLVNENEEEEDEDYELSDVESDDDSFNTDDFEPEGDEDINYAVLLGIHGGQRVIMHL